MSFLLDKLYTDKGKLNADLLSTKGKLNLYFSTVTDNNGNRVGVTPNMSVKLNNVVKTKSLEKQLKFFANRLDNKETSAIDKELIKQHLDETKKELANTNNIINEIDGIMTPSEKEAYKKVADSQLPIYKDLVHKQTTLDYTEKTIDIHENALKQLKPYKTVNEFKRAYKPQKQQSEAIIPEDIQSARNEAKNAQESPSVESNPVDQFVDDIANGVERNSLEDQQLYENNKVEIEQKLKDKVEQERQVEEPIAESTNDFTHLS